MISFVWFSFEGDSACLVESVKSVRRVYGSDVPVCIFDDSKAPISADDLTTISPSLYEKTEWDRGGNLRGGIAITGMIDCMRRAAEVTKADWVSKIDCDTILIKPWLDDDLKWAYQGTSWGSEQLGAGLNYIMRKDVPARILKHIAGRPGIFKGECPEDNTIALLAATCFPGGLLIHDSAYGGKNRLAAGWVYSKFRPSTPQDCMKFAAITFGNRYMMQDLPREKRNSQIARDRVAQTMRMFNSWLVNQA
ncbi:hypothetical protein QET93_011255 [Akkermansia sp. N21116]|uniref:hypothetical protein n=1 Tax=Akkermansia sp. N21116 TaxID=3040764 RepID=UPI00244EC800|nr:hypothetical protein [Akkermansia sp. N21116]WPX40109.1 hypothetical protein QET93_011255 [Akkermansia sp. N21116]